MQRFIGFVILAGLLVTPNGQAQTPAPGTVQVNGRINILEKNNKPSPDLDDAVLYLEGPVAAAAEPVTVEIAITDKTYAPQVVVVPVGSSVRFPNHDPFNHNVFSASEPNSFDLGLYGRGAARSQTFAHPGLVRVFCNIHPRMVAYVQVMANRYFTQPGTDGSFRFANVPPGTYRLHVWHGRIPAEVVQEITAGNSTDESLEIALDGRGYRWERHRNKFGKDYPTNAGRERY